jgi:hypothetical protein
MKERFILNQSGKAEALKQSFNTFILYKSLKIKGMRGYDNL